MAPEKQLVLVHYIHVGNMAADDVKPYMEKAKEELLSNPKLAEHILYFIPTKEESRVECIYPKQ